MAVDAAVAAAEDADLVVVTTNNAYAVNAATGQPTTAGRGADATGARAPRDRDAVVVSAMRNPYDVASFPAAPTVLDTYGYTADQVEALVRVLFGEVDPTGRLPVSIPDREQDRRLSSASGTASATDPGQGQPSSRNAPRTEPIAWPTSWTSTVRTRRARPRSRADLEDGDAVERDRVRQGAGRPSVVARARDTR